MKYITFVVPCYNSAAYRRHCIDTLLPGGEDVEILIVNDGSTDGTYQIANEYREKYPTIVRAIHKENGGHGSGVNIGIEQAQGVYLKVVDSDDWVDDKAYKEYLSCIKEHVDNGDKIDLFFTNYVYENVRKHKPANGLVQLLTVTEKQYANMEYLVGSSSGEYLNSIDSLVIL